MPHTGNEAYRQGIGPPRRATHQSRIIRILVAHQNPSDVDVWLQELKRAQFAVSADIVQTRDEFAERLRQYSYDVVLANHSMPGWPAAQIVELLREFDRDTPLIVVTGEMENYIVDDFLHQGISDCVDHKRLARLPVAVGIAVEGKSLRSEHNRVETELRHSEAHYRALVENPTFGICRIDADGRFVDVNEALVKMLGYESKDELMAMSLASDIIRDPRERAQLFEPYQQTGHINGMELEWRRKDGTPMKVRLSGRGVGPGQGVPGGCEIIAEDVTAHRASEDHFRHLAATDGLTGLANYRRFAEALAAEIERSKRTGRSFAVLAFDLDGMKAINDSHGHLTGNRALCRLADLFRFACRSIDMAARCGGDEFALILPETGGKEADLVARRICASLANDHEIPALAVSVGVAVYPENGESIEDLLRAADQALYKMKRQ